MGCKGEGDRGIEYVWGLKERASGMVLGKMGNGIKMLSISGWGGGGEEG